MADPLVTVAIPVKDGENFLGAALDSILAQDFGDFRVFISENGSSDGTLDVIRDYAARDARIEYASDPVPMGQSPNHTKAVVEATTPWVKLLCHDDLLRPDCMTQVAAAIRSADERVALIGNGHRHLFANGFALDHRRGGAARRYDGPSAVRAFLGGRADFSLPAISTACVRKSAFVAIGGFDSRWQHHDTMGWLNLLTRHNLIYLPDTLTDVRIHEGQITHELRKSLRVVEDWQAFLPEFVAAHGDVLDLSPALRARLRLMPANVGARAVALEWRAGRRAKALALLRELPAQWWPLMPPLIARALIVESRRVAPLNGRVEAGELVPDAG